MNLSKKLISIPNFDDSECFKWYVVRYLHPPDHHLAINREILNLFGDELDFKDIKCPDKINDIGKSNEKNFVGTDDFDYENKQKISDLCVEKYFQKTCRFILNTRKRQKALLCYQRF